MHVKKKFSFFTLSWFISFITPKWWWLFSCQRTRRIGLHLKLANLTFLRIHGYGTIFWVQSNIQYSYTYIKRRIVDFTMSLKHMNNERCNSTLIGQIHIFRKWSGNEDSVIGETERRKEKKNRQTAKQRSINDKMLRMMVYQRRGSRAWDSEKCVLSHIIMIKQLSWTGAFSSRQTIDHKNRNKSCNHWRICHHEALKCKII